MGENFDNAGLEEDENSDSTEDEVDSIVQSPSVAVRALEDDIDDAGLLRGMLQVSENSGEVEKSEFVWSFGWQLSLATIFNSGRSNRCYMDDGPYSMDPLAVNFACRNFAEIGLFRCFRHLVAREAW